MAARAFEMGQIKLKIPQIALKRALKAQKWPKSIHKEALDTLKWPKSRLRPFEMGQIQLKTGLKRPENWLYAVRVEPRTRLHFCLHTQVKPENN